MFLTDIIILALEEDPSIPKDQKNVKEEGCFE